MRQVHDLIDIEATGPVAALGEFGYCSLNSFLYDAVVHHEKRDDFGSSPLRLAGMRDASTVKVEDLLLEKINPSPKLTIA